MSDSKHTPQYERALARQAAQRERGLNPEFTKLSWKPGSMPFAELAASIGAPARSQNLAQSATDAPALSRVIESSLGGKHGG